MTIAPGTRLANYEVVSLLGVGGMGEVYLAHDTRLDRKVALKFLSKDFLQDTDRLHRFEQEARVASALNHPNIITVYEIDQAENLNFIAIEFVNGETLRERIRRGPLSLRDVLDIAKQIASALAAAHDAGIVHRDIKPENIMVRPDGLVKVLDFGLAKQTERRLSTADLNSSKPFTLKTDPGTRMGTPHYMSPEQARGLEVDGRTDIFSLGALLYEIVTRHTPFEGETASDLIAEILKTEPLPIAHHVPDAPVELQRIISKAMSKKREDRYQHARELQMDLKALKHEVKYRSSSLERIPTMELKIDPEPSKADFSTRLLDQKKTTLDQKKTTMNAVYQTGTVEPPVRGKSRPLIATLIALLVLAAAALLYFFRS